MDLTQFDPLALLHPESALRRRAVPGPPGSRAVQVEGIGEKVLRGSSREITGAGLTVELRTRQHIPVFIPVTITLPTLSQSRAGYIAWVKPGEEGVQQVGLQTDEPFLLDGHLRTQTIEQHERRTDIRIDGLDPTAGLEAFSSLVFWAAAAFRSSDQLIGQLFDLEAPGDGGSVRVIGSAADGRGRAGLRIASSVAVAEVVRVLVPMVSEHIVRLRKDAAAGASATTTGGLMKDPRSGVAELAPRAATLLVSVLQGDPRLRSGRVFRKHSKERALLQQAVLPALAMLLSCGDRVRVQRLAGG